MNNIVKKIILLFSLFSLTSCKQLLKEVYNGNYYNSPIFEENFFTRKLSSLSQNVDEVIPYSLDKTKDGVFTSFNDMSVDKDAKLSIHGENKDKPLYYEEDYVSNDSFSLYDIGYGPTRKMSLIDDSFKYGYVSKLFDGQMFCNGRYQNARVQIDESGFDHLFTKEINSYDLDGNKTYFALNFKAAVDYTTDVKVSSHLSKIDLHISFYMKKTNNHYKKVTTTYRLENIPTNPIESHSENAYSFYGFEFNGFDIDRLCGFSISYDLIEDQYVQNNNLKYSLLLYEMLIPFTYWI